ncbi:nucleosidase [Corynebacterium provencense]|uniref:5'-methylthioadenosine/S-adenosylhomocysteine nucleosidase n=1 Tax=Corynebacterium provencense TaxID=1737425 RepID=A0A2Z3YNP4_9CORY|nr:nucleosidase [Corynebacterium provencense]AWT25449.1 5'-methylthioadenosine/S-adenosylhomocysteine nucleosidase [Corynebacterium provencense]MCI1256164.1 nucleosidase [Corynebacterium provencense]
MNHSTPHRQLPATAALHHGEITPGRPLLVVATAGEAAELTSGDPRFDDLPVLLSGIGRINATLALTDCLHRYLAAGGLPAAVINLGTAGALRPGLTGVHRINRVRLHDFSHASVAALTGADEYPLIDLDSDLPGERAEIDTLDGVDRDAAVTVTLATGDVFVESAPLRDRLAQDADLVDMEGYAVARVARWFGVPVQLIKVVSDDAGDAAGTTWRDELPRMAVEIAAHARQALSTGDGAA